MKFTSRMITGAALLLILSFPSIAAKPATDLTVKARVYVSPAAAAENPEVERKIARQLEQINELYHRNGVHLTFVPYKISFYSDKTPWQLANSLGGHNEDVVIICNSAKEPETMGGFMGDGDTNRDGVRELPCSITIGHNFAEGLFTDNGMRALAHELGHLRGCADLYTPDGKFQYPGDDIMKYPYGCSVFSANVVALFNRYAALGTHRLVDTHNFTPTSKQPVLEDKTEALTCTEDARFYRIYLNEDFAELTVKVTGAPGAKLQTYIKYQTVPTEKDYDSADWTKPNEQSISIYPRKGLYFVMVKSVKGAAKYGVRFEVK